MGEFGLGHRYRERSQALFGVSGLVCELFPPRSLYLSTQHSPPLPAHHILGRLVPCMQAGLPPLKHSLGPVTQADSGGPGPTQEKLADTPHPG